MKRIERLIGRQIVGCILFVAGMAWIPYAWHSRLAERWFSGDAELQAKLANSMEHWMREGLDRNSFTTGSKQFDGEWLYGTYVMAAMGFGQMALEQPENKIRYLALMEEAIGEVLSDRVREYPKAIRRQNGDIDSGAVIFGYGLSPTGFALGGARLHNDPNYFKHLYATANAAGAPLQTKERFSFVTGASLGDAILFAMLTAHPGGITGIGK